MRRVARLVGLISELLLVIRAIVPGEPVVARYGTWPAPGAGPFPGG